MTLPSSNFSFWSLPMIISWACAAAVSATRAPMTLPTSLDVAMRSSSICAPLSASITMLARTMPGRKGVANSNRSRSFDGTRRPLRTGPEDRFSNNECRFSVWRSVIRRYARRRRACAVSRHGVRPREPVAHRPSLFRKLCAAYWTLNSRCCRFEVCGRTSLGHRPHSTASAHCGLCRTCGSSIS